jgi:protein ImuB
MHGGLEALVGRVRAGIAAMDLAAQLGVAPTARAALWLARGGGRRLEELPVAVLDAEEETLEFLRSIGISTVGELLQLPRGGLARRCGVRLLEDLDRAFGSAPEPRSFFSPPPRFAAKLELPAAAAHAEGLLFAARRLLVQLEGLLAARQAGIRRFTLALLHRNAAPTVLEVGCASPARETGRLARLLGERLARLALARPVEAIGIEAGEFEPLHESTAGFFGDARAEAESWAQLVERLQARLGGEAIHGFGVHPDHRPERAWRRADAGSRVPAACDDLGPRPLWLVEPPRRLAEAGFELLAGPERIESGWWDGGDIARDYFVARASGTALLWVFRERGGGWFLHGIFA